MRVARRQRARRHARRVRTRTEWLLIALSVAARARRHLPRVPRLPAAAGARDRGSASAGARSTSCCSTSTGSTSSTTRSSCGRSIALSRALWHFWDEKVVDGSVNGVGYTLEGLSAVLRLFQTGFVGTYALFFTLGVARPAPLLPEATRRDRLPWLSWLIFFPLAGRGADRAACRRGASGRSGAWAAVVALAEFAFSLPLWWRFVPDATPAGSSWRSATGSGARRELPPRRRRHRAAARAAHHA